MSIPRALLLALALLQAVGITDYMRRIVCEEECKQDGCDDKGPCDCSTCACHCPDAPSLTPANPIAFDAPTPTNPALVVFADSEHRRATPDPREILHVPRTYAG